MKPKILGVALQKKKQANKQTKKGISEVDNQLKKLTKERR